MTCNDTLSAATGGEQRLRCMSHIIVRLYVWNALSALSSKQHHKGHTLIDCFARQSFLVVIVRWERIAIRALRRGCPNHQSLDRLEVHIPWNIDNTTWHCFEAVRDDPHQPAHRGGAQLLRLAALCSSSSRRG